MTNTVDGDQEDILSELPLDVIGTILSKLLLTEAARTCLLSKNWRNRWTWKPEIVIKDKCFPNFRYGHRWELITPIFSWFRENYHGSIWRFELDTQCRIRCSDLDTWFSFLAEKGVREITVRNQYYANYSPQYNTFIDLPSSIFSSAKLSRLEISRGFQISSPNHSSRLKTLELNQVSINREELESLLRFCVSLERLILVEISDLEFPRVCSQTLNFLKLCSNFEDISLEGCPSLSELEITMFNHRVPLSQQFERGKVSNLFRILGCLCDTLKKLTISGFFVQFLGNGDLIQSPRPSFDHLITLEINGVKFNSPEDVAAASELLIASPILEQLYISNASRDARRMYENIVMEGDHSSMPLDDYFDAKHLSRDKFNRLKLAKFMGFQETKSEWSFLKRVLDKSPNLEKMIIVCPRIVKVKHIPESEMVKYEKASRKGSKRPKRRLGFQHL